MSSEGIIEAVKKSKAEGFFWQAGKWMERRAKRERGTGVNRHFAKAEAKGCCGEASQS